MSNTDKEMINKFKDYADCADAAYAKLHYVFENIDSIFESKKWEEADNIMLGDKTNDNIKDSNDENVILHKKAITPRILSDEFWGFGPESMMWKLGKVFENKQYNKRLENERKV